jgi:hypothetical protein
MRVEGVSVSPVTKRPVEMTGGSPSGFCGDKMGASALCDRAVRFVTGKT